MKVLGINDDQSFCQCCGKENLKAVVWIQFDSGEIVHYGRICASKKWLHLPEKGIKDMATEEKKNVIRQIQDTLRDCLEVVANRQAYKEAREARLTGKAFFSYNLPSTELLNNRINAEINKYPSQIGIRVVDIYLPI